MVAPGGMRGCSGGAWLLRGGVCGIRRDTEIRSMSGRYASYWNAFLFGDISRRSPQAVDTSHLQVVRTENSLISQSLQHRLMLGTKLPDPVQLQG